MRTTLARAAGREDPLLTLKLVVQQLLELCSKACFVLRIRHCGIAGGLAVLRGIKVQRCILRSHGFDQRGMNPADFAGEYEEARVLL